MAVSRPLPRSPNTRHRGMVVLPALLELARLSTLGASSRCTASRGEYGCLSGRRFGSVAPSGPAYLAQVAAWQKTACPRRPGTP
jgi:hypothetical protein